MVIGVAADQLIKELGYSSVDKQLDRRNVIVRMDAVRSELMTALAYDGVIFNGQFQIKIDKNPTEFPDVFYMSKTTPVTFDTQRQRFTSNMPTEYVSFANVNGIRQVKPTQGNYGGYFWNQKAGSSSAYGMLESAQLGGNIGFELEGQVIFYNNMPANTYTEVLITYIPKLSGLRETDIMPMSSEFESMLLDKTKQSFLLQRQVEEDKILDSTSK